LKINVKKPIHRALNKKLRAEELLKLSKLPPSMAKREEENKKKEALEEMEASETQPLTKNNVEFALQKKKKLRKKIRRAKTAIGQSSSRAYVFESKNRDKDKASVKVNTESRNAPGNLIKNFFHFFFASLT
jgi:hypothetical protein